VQQLPKTLREEKWIQIMSNDSSVNYFEAEASFQKFYTAFRAKENARQNKAGEDAKEEEEHAKSPEEYFIAGYLKWSIAIKPFVLPDGRIMPVGQRLLLIQQARNRIKQ
jgi:hypothetical protein